MKIGILKHIFNKIPKQHFDVKYKETQALLQTKLAYSLNKTKDDFWQFYEKHDIFEDFFGIISIKDAQAKVIEAEKALVKAQSDCRAAQNRVNDVKKELGVVLNEKINTALGDDKFMQLATKDYEPLLIEDLNEMEWPFSTVVTSVNRPQPTRYEHSLVKKHTILTKRFSELENTERERFTILQMAIKECHEKEKIQAEELKHLTLLASLSGALVGLLIGSIKNYLRVQNLIALANQPREKLLDIINYWETNGLAANTSLNHKSISQILEQTSQKSEQIVISSKQSPEQIVQSPEDTTQSPEHTTQTPEHTTQNPEHTTQIPEHTTHEQIPQSTDQSAQSPSLHTQSDEMSIQLSSQDSSHLRKTLDYGLMVTSILIALYHLYVKIC